MDNVLTGIKLFGAGIIALLTYIFGGVDTVLVILLAFITLDYITGIMAGIIEKQLSSAVGYRGLLKKSVYFNRCSGFAPYRQILRT